MSFIRKQKFSATIMAYKVYEKKKMYIFQSFADSLNKIIYSPIVDWDILIDLLNYLFVIFQMILHILFEHVYLLLFY